MDCDFDRDCDGTGVVRCGCDCEHCVEDTNHVSDCEGCRACDSNPAMCAIRGHEVYESEEGAGGDVMFTERCERTLCQHSRVVTRAMFCAEHGHTAVGPSLDPRFNVCGRCGVIPVAA